MKDVYLELLENAIAHAKDTGSFNALNLIEEAGEFCIWGCGKFFEEAYIRQFSSRGFPAKYVVDSNPQKVGKVYFDCVKCISPEELYQLQNPVVLPLLNNGCAEVIQLLQQHDIAWIQKQQYFFDMQENGERSREWFERQIPKILEVYHLLEDEASRRVYANTMCNRIACGLSRVHYKDLCTGGQYFMPEGLYKIDRAESFVDVGAFNGDTIEEFLMASHMQFESIHSLEISRNTYNKLVERVEKYPEEVRSKIHCYNLGAWSEEKFLSCGEENTHTGEGCSINKGKGNFLKEDEIEVSRCVALDQLLDGQRVSILKMDIEGAEQNALEGCRQIIVNQKPKLAICIYHNLSDMWEVPLKIKEMNQDYRIAVRHHTRGFGDTVCYAY